MEYMYNVYNSNTASYEPRHDKICRRGVRPGRRHKMVCIATEASWRLEGPSKKSYSICLDFKRLCQGPCIINNCIFVLKLKPVIQST